MNKYQEKWLKALESGDYKQQTGTLGTKRDGYCCLGVAAVVISGFDDNVIIRFGNLSSSEFNDTLHKLRLRDGDGGFSEIRKIHDADNDREPTVTISSFVGLNDDALFDFAQIAEFARANPDLVFLDTNEVD